MRLASEEVLYRKYMEFFELAERRRRWSIFDDVPWDRWDPGCASPDRARCAETFCAVEAYLPDYVGAGLNLVRDSFGQSWFHANWGYEESKHALALREYLVRTGQRDPADVQALTADVLSRSWTLPFDTPRRMVVYGALQEKATWMIYRHHLVAARRATDEVLAAIYAFIARDEAAHAGFYQDVLQACFEEDRPGTLRDVHHVLLRFTMPAHDLVPDYDDRVALMRSAGIDHSVFLSQVVLPVLRRCGTTRAELWRAARVPHPAPVARPAPVAHPAPVP